MSNERRTLGFDRDLRLSWLDATADWVAEGMSVKDLRGKLDALLEGQVAGEGSHSAKGKTETVLLHIWAAVPEGVRPLRDAGLALLPEQDRDGRLALHWGMALATYPFFRDLVTIVGRLLEMQGTVTSQQVARRMAESWGQTSTVLRAVPRALKSLVEWSVVRDTGEKGVFATAAKVALGDRKSISVWLIEAALRGSEAETVPFRHLTLSPALFPFSLGLSVFDLDGHPRLEVYRQGLDEDIVTLKRRFPGQQEMASQLL